MMSNKKVGYIAHLQVYNFVVYNDFKSCYT